MIAIKFLLLDKEEKLYPIFGDILDITGHKLMVALDEAKALDLLNMPSPDLLIIKWENMDFLFSILKDDKFILPIFLVEDYQQVEEIKKLGFSDLNILVLPFNPMEFLSKSFKLYTLRTDKMQVDSPNLGIMNVIIHLLSKNVSTEIELSYDDRVCKVYLKDGFVRGLSCSPEEFFEMLNAEDVQIHILPYEEEKLSTYFRKNEEFFSLLTTGTFVKVPETYTEGLFQLSTTKHGLTPIGETLYLISAVDQESLLQRNAYLRLYHKSDLRIPMLFNLVPSQQFSVLKDSIEGVLGGIEHLKGLILMDLLPEDTQSLFNLLSLSPRLYLITSFPIALSLISLGVPERRIKLVESFPEGLLSLGTGDTLRFVKTPFLPDKGSFVALDDSTKILFSSKLFSSYCLPEDYSPTKTANINMVLLYHSLNFSGFENLSALSIIKLFAPTAIRPAFGNPILENVDEFIDRFLKHKVSFNQANLEDEPLVLGLVSGILFEVEREMPKEKYESLLDSLSEYADVKNGVVSKIFVDTRRFPELFLYALHSTKPTPKVLLSALYKFVKAEIPVFTI
ncbi:hypothetical protein [Thermocrinis sp.]